MGAREKVKTKIKERKGVYLIVERNKD